MTYDGIILNAAETTTGGQGAGARGLLRRAADWIEACADYYAASVMYEELLRLSDAELRRRGLSRETLARDICTVFDRAP
jgi:hypothetical protein